MTALFREIVMNGNTVVITFNQLIDSRFFLSLLNDEKWSEVIIRLFKLGAIRISQFGKYRTPSQYLISQGLESNDEFIFSGLPIKSNQKSLIALTKRCLMYSDLTELDEYITSKRTQRERELLFREQVKDPKTNSISIENSNLDFNQMMNTLQDLKVVLTLILEFSNIPNVYNPPKDFSAHKNVDLKTYLDRVKEIETPSIPYWKESIEILVRSIESVEHKNKRSEIVKSILAEYKTAKDVEHAFEKYSLAQAIVDLCYNYTCEQSVLNISKHYNISEFYNKTDYSTFDSDFLWRLKKYIGKNRERHFLIEESNDFVPYEFKKRWFCNLRRAANLLEHEKILTFVRFKDKSKDANSNGDVYIYPYEYKLFSQRFKQRIKTIGCVWLKLIFTFYLLLFAFAIENYIYDGIENFLDLRFEHFFNADKSNWYIFVIAAIVSAVLVELISILLSKAFKKLSDHINESVTCRIEININLPSLGESLENLISQLADLFCSLISWGIPYSNRKNAPLLKLDDVENAKVINYVSRSVSEYKKYKYNYLEKNKDNNNARLFNDSSIYPMLDISKEGADVRLTLLEEMTDKSYGLVYQSDYNTLLVDPVFRTGDFNSDNDIFSYERMNKSVIRADKKAGVVVVPVIKKDGEDYLVLLKQYRHSIRDYQICFPRGFNEFGKETSENASIELGEEINAEIIEKNPFKDLGVLTPDSGILCGYVSIFEAQIKSYKLKENYEGITSIDLYRPEDVERMIKDGDIDDGFTISAYSLWKMKR